MLGCFRSHQVLSARGIVRPAICFVKPQTTTSSAFILGHTQDVASHSTGFALWALGFRAICRFGTATAPPEGRSHERPGVRRTEPPYKARGRLVASPGCIGRVTGRLSPPLSLRGEETFNLCAPKKAEGMPTRDCVIFLTKRRKMTRRAVRDGKQHGHPVRVGNAQLSRWVAAGNTGEVRVAQPLVRASGASARRPRLVES